MSKSDHSKSRKQERPGAMRINGELYAVPRRWHAEPIEREAIEASIADNGFVVRRRTVIAPWIDHPQAQPVHYTTGSELPNTLGQRLDVLGWNDHADALDEILSDAPMPEWERELRNPTRMPVKVQPRKRVQHVHRDRPIRNERPRDGWHADMNAGVEAPSLMQMAKARARALGL